MDFPSASASRSRPARWLLLPLWCVTLPLWYLGRHAAFTLRFVRRRALRWSLGVLVLYLPVGLGARVWWSVWRLDFWYLNTTYRTVQALDRGLGDHPVVDRFCRWWFLSNHNHGHYFRFFDWQYWLTVATLPVLGLLLAAGLYFLLSVAGVVRHRLY